MKTRQGPSSYDRRALTIVARSFVRDLKTSGLGTTDILAVATEILAVVADSVRRRER